MKRIQQIYLLIILFVPFTLNMKAQVLFELSYSQPNEFKAIDLEDIIIISGESTQLGGSEVVSGGTKPYTYFWEPSTGLDSNNIPNPITTLYETIDYTLTVVDKRGCELVVQQTVDVKQVSSSQENPLEENFVVYPNPNDGIFSIEVYNIHHSADLSVEIYNLAGQQIFNKVFESPSDTFIGRVNLSNQSSGAYIVKLKLGKGSHYRFIVVN